MISATGQSSIVSDSMTLPNQASDIDASELSTPIALLTWRIVRASQSPAKLCIVCAAIFATFFLGTLVMHSVIAGLIGAMLVLASVKEFALPMTYVLTAKSAQVKCLGIVCHEINWADIQTIYTVQGGLKLSPNVNPMISRTEQMRGVTLQISKDQRPNTLKTIQLLAGKHIQTFTRSSVQ